MQSIQSLLFPRKKRQTRNVGQPVLSGKLMNFIKAPQVYRNFIRDLRDRVTNPKVDYGYWPRQSRVTKHDGGVTKIRIEGTEGHQVEFVFRNKDLYLIGAVVDSVLYLDMKVYNEYHVATKSNPKGTVKLPSSWSDVIGHTGIRNTFVEFSYGKILPFNRVLDYQNIESSLKNLAQVGRSTQYANIFANNIGIFVVTFAEAVRFRIVEDAVNCAIQQLCGTSSLRLKEIDPLSGFILNDIIRKWDRISEMLDYQYNNKPGQKAPTIKINDKDVTFNKTELAKILAVASVDVSPTTPTKRPGRPKRDLSHLPYEAIKQPTLLENKIDLLDHQGKNPASDNSVPVGSITPHSPDVLGALQLLAVGLLYLSSRKFNLPIGSFPSSYDPREAQAIAAELTGRIVCFLDSSGALSLGYDDAMELQRQLASGLVQGYPVDRLFSKFLEYKYTVKYDGNDLQGNINLEKLHKFVAGAMFDSNRGFPNAAVEKCAK